LNLWHEHVKICMVCPGFLFGLMEDQLVEEFHNYWIGLVKEGIVKNIFDFERVFREFKREQGML